MAIQFLEIAPLAGATAVVRVAADTVDDLAEISGVTPVLGSTALVAEDGKTYMLGSDGEWHEQKGTGGGVFAESSIALCDAAAPVNAEVSGEFENLLAAVERGV